VRAIKREIRKTSPGIKVEEKEIEEILRNEVLKRDVIEGEEASKTLSRVRRLSRKTKKQVKKPPANKIETVDVSDTSFSEQPLKTTEEDY